MRRHDVYGHYNNAGNTLSGLWYHDAIGEQSENAISALGRRGDVRQNQQVKRTMRKRADHGHFLLPMWYGEVNLLLPFVRYEKDYQYMFIYNWINRNGGTAWFCWTSVLCLYMSNLNGRLFLLFISFAGWSVCIRVNSSPEGAARGGLSVCWWLYEVLLYQNERRPGIDSDYHMFMV